MAEFIRVDCRHCATYSMRRKGWARRQKIGGILRNEIEHIFKSPQSIAQ
jgi:hypothetical protein